MRLPRLRSAARRGAAAFAAAAALVLALAAPDAVADDGPFDAAPDFEALAELLAPLARDGLTVGVEDRFAARTQVDAEEARGVMARIRFSGGGALQPYAGLGLGRAPELPGDPGEAVAGRLVGGVAAPVADGFHLFGEYQNVRQSAGRGAYHRALIGLRRAF